MTPHHVSNLNPYVLFLGTAMHHLAMINLKIIPILSHWHQSSRIHVILYHTHRRRLLFWGCSTKLSWPWLHAFSLVTRNMQKLLVMKETFHFRIYRRREAYSDWLFRYSAVKKKKKISFSFMSPQSLQALCNLLSLIHPCSVSPYSASNCVMGLLMKKCEQSFIDYR